MENVFLPSGSALVISDYYSRFYFSGVDIAEGVFVLINSEKFYFSDRRYFLALSNKLKGKNIKALVLENNSLIDFLSDKKINTLYLDFTKTTVSEYNAYKKSFNKVLDGRVFIDSLREVKSIDEIKKIKKACSIIEKAFYLTVPKIKLGITELEVKDILISNALSLGAKKESFDTIVAFGINSAVPHHQTGEGKLKNNSVILIDTGVYYNGYVSDFTRTLFFGNPSKKFIDAYNAVLGTNLICEREIKAGISGKDAHLIALNNLNKYGLGKYFTHGLGHGVGVEIHESPSLSPKSDSVLKENSAFTIEPGVYFDNEFGIRIEDTCFIKDGKVKKLFTDNKKLIIIK